MNNWSFAIEYQMSLQTKLKGISLGDNYNEYKCE